MNTNSLQFGKLNEIRTHWYNGQLQHLPGGVAKKVSAPFLGLPSRGAPGSLLDANNGTTSRVGQYSKTGYRIGALAHTQ